MNPCCVQRRQGFHAEDCPTAPGKPLVEQGEPVSLVATGCHDCPFAYDGFRCDHPMADDSVVSLAYDMETAPPTCPLRMAPALVRLVVPS